MNTRRLLLTVLSMAALSACAPKAEPASAASEASAASAASEAANTVQTLTSKDNRIKIVVENGHFRNIADQPDAYPEGLSAKEITLLQRDDALDITLYASNLGKAQTDAKTYFGNLKSALENAQGLSNVRVGIATDNRMNYQFSQSGANGTLTESCIAIHETDLYNVCASSHSASIDTLAELLTDVNLLKTLP